MNYLAFASQSYDDWNLVSYAKYTTFCGREMDQIWLETEVDVNFGGLVHIQTVAILASLLENDVLYFWHENNVIKTLCWSGSRIPKKPAVYNF